MSSPYPRLSLLVLLLLMSLHAHSQSTVNAAAGTSVVLAELLASHGYVVASVSLIGPTSERLAQGRSAADFEATVRDMEFALAIPHKLDTH